MEKQKEQEQKDGLEELRAVFAEFPDYEKEMQEAIGSEILRLQEEIKILRQILGEKEDRLSSLSKTAEDKARRKQKSDEIYRKAKEDRLSLLQAASQLSSFTAEEELPGLK